jgi:hypothetical protein
MRYGGARMKRQMRVLIPIVVGFIVVSGCATTSLNRVDPSEIERISSRLYANGQPVQAIEPARLYRVSTVFSIVGDDEAREDTASSGVEIRTSGIGSQVDANGLVLWVPVSAAVRSPEITLSFARTFERRDVRTTLDWTMAYPIRWPAATERNFDGNTGQNGADVVVELAYFDASDVPNAPGERMIIAHVYRKGSSGGEVILLDANGRLTVTARGGAGAPGSTGANPALLGTSYSSRPPTRDFFEGRPGGNGGNGGSGGEVQVISPFGFPELQDRVTVHANGGNGGAGGEGGFHARLMVTRVRTASGTGEFWRYARDGRAAGGAPGRPGNGGVWLKQDAPVDNLFQNLPRADAGWFDRRLLIRE